MRALIIRDSCYEAMVYWLNSILRVLQTEQQPKILVIGDVILDRYYWEVDKPIPQKVPLSMIHLGEESFELGGAANVANSLCALGAEVRLISVIGLDTTGEKIISLLQTKKISTETIYRSPNKRTSEKTRILIFNQPIIRIDSETKHFVFAKEEKVLSKWFKEYLSKSEVVIVSDYQKGVLTDSLLRIIIKETKKQNIPVICDPKGKDYSKYHQATLVTPNRKEVEEATNISINSECSLIEAGKQLLERHQFAQVLITLAEEGMCLFQDKTVYRIPTQTVKFFDIIGAGDIVVACLAYGIAQGIPLLEACYFSNIVAGAMVNKLGRATISLEGIVRLAEQKYGTCAKPIL